MKEKYIKCPNCENMVEKENNQCPYCLTPLNWVNTSNFFNNFLREYKSYTQNSAPTTKYNNEKNSVENLDEEEENNPTTDTDSPYFIQSILEIDKRFQSIQKKIDDKWIIIIIIGFAMIILIFWLSSVYEEYQAYLAWQ